MSVPIGRPRRGHAARVTVLIAVAFAACFVPVAASPGDAGARDGLARVYVVQGVPRATVAVSIDGQGISSGMEPKAVSTPLMLARGAHVATFATNDWTVRTHFRVDTSSADLVLHWPADKTVQPEVTVYANDLRAVAVRKARLTVAHTAVVPPADVRVDGKVVFANIANGEFVTANVPSGSYAIDIVPTGESGEALLGPVDIPVQGGELTRVFAIGEPENNSMDVVVQTLPLERTGSAAPDRVDAGSAGLVAPNVPTANKLVENGGGGAGAVIQVAERGLLVFVVLTGIAVAVNRRDSSKLRAGR